MPDTGRIEQPGRLLAETFIFPGNRYWPIRETRAIPGVSFCPFLSFLLPFLDPTSTLYVVTVLSKLHTYTPPLSRFVPASFGSFIVVYDIQPFVAPPFILSSSPTPILLPSTSFSLCWDCRSIIVVTSNFTSTVQRTSFCVVFDWSALYTRCFGYLKIGDNGKIYAQ